MNPLVVIVGGGPAGLTAAARLVAWQVPVVLLEQNARLGGQLWSINNAIRDYPGREASHGAQFAQQMIAQLRLPAGVIQLRQRVTGVEPGSGIHLQLAGGGDLQAPAVIAAVGARRRTPAIDGFSDVPADRISFSATTDTHIGSGQTVAVAGGGDGAVENALILARRAVRVHLICRSPQLRARRLLREALTLAPNIVLHLHCALRQLSATTFGLRLHLSGPDGPRALDTDAVVFKLGYEPNSEGWSPPAACDPTGHLMVNPRGETSVPGVFAAGDVSNPAAPSIAAAVGQGATAARSAFDYLRTQGYDL